MTQIQLDVIFLTSFSASITLFFLVKVFSPRSENATCEAILIISRLTVSSASKTPGQLNFLAIFKVSKAPSFHLVSAK